MIDRQSFYDERAWRRPAEMHRIYHRLLQSYYSFLIPPGQRVLELGCGLGDLLAAVQPSQGVGVDFSPSMIKLARQRHPKLVFHVAEASEFADEPPFDYIILSDLVDDHPDVQRLLAHLHRLSHSRTRLVLNFFNRLWRPILALAERLGGKAPTLQQNWLSRLDMENLLRLSGWEVVKWDGRILWPIRTPGWEKLLNCWMAPFLKHGCLAIFQAARPAPQAHPDRQYTCSVIVPARNEAGNIQSLVERIPEMGASTEIVFIEGHSQDCTWEEIHRVARLYPQRRIRILKQQSQGKAGAVREAFDHASGELLIILDADLTMPPEQLPRFYEAARSGLAEFVNGVRLVYPMDQDAMRWGNMAANKFFSVAFSWLLGQTVKDTLCGTKSLFRTDYQLMAAHRAYFGEMDPFGDFDLLCGAARLSLRIVDLPIRYAARTYGRTNIHRWRDGWRLLHMIIGAARRMKWIA